MHKYTFGMSWDLIPICLKFVFGCIIFYSFSIRMIPAIHGACRFIVFLLLKILHAKSQLLKRVLGLLLVIPGNTTSDSCCFCSYKTFDSHVCSRPTTMDEMRGMHLPWVLRNEASVMVLC